LRCAVISDVHGNAHALTSVLEAIDAATVDAVWCLGDVVGYGPQPNGCVRVVSERAAICLAGNHDLLAIGREVLPSDFNPDAAAAGAWTAAAIDGETRAFLSGLSPEAHADGLDLFHASPRDPVWEYVLSEEAAEAAFALTESPLVLLGHSHVPLAIRLAEDGHVAGGHAPMGTEAVLHGGRWLLNPGSVGQPRDGDPRAAWLLLDIELGSAEYRRVPYDIAATQEEIRAAGLPAALAERLAFGL
jgi:diadenosine tetraphosphatase ApaH/serine/threonine PP2A family protein phosphatase